jgi:membrane protease YdiL (CAAX protease family)
VRSQSDPISIKESKNQLAVTDAATPQNATSSLQPRPWSRIDRLRLIIWALIAFLVPAAIVLGLHLIGDRSGSVFTVGDELPTKTVMVFFASLATWIMSRVEKRCMADYGIPLPPLGTRIIEGSLWGFSMLSAILLILRVSGHFRIDSVALSRTAVFRYALAWGATFLAVSLSEEFAFRGYWLFSLSRRIRFWRAAIFVSLIFGAAHLGNHGENVLGILQVVATGLLFCFTIRRTGNLWFAVGFHAAWDWGETFFYGTPDSALLGVGRFLNTSMQGPTWLTGGSAGPEGSIIAIFVLVLCAMLIHLRFPTAIYPDRPV